MMGIVVPETCWAYEKYNKIISGIWLVFILQLSQQWRTVKQTSDAYINYVWPLSGEWCSVNIWVFVMREVYILSSATVGNNVWGGTLSLTL